MLLSNNKHSIVFNPSGLHVALALFFHRYLYCHFSFTTVVINRFYCRLTRENDQNPKIYIIICFRIERLLLNSARSQRAIWLGVFISLYVLFIHNFYLYFFRLFFSSCELYVITKSQFVLSTCQTKRFRRCSQIKHFIKGNSIAVVTFVAVTVVVSVVYVFGWAPFNLLKSILVISKPNNASQNILIRTKKCEMKVSRWLAREYGRKNVGFIGRKRR